MHVRTCTGTRPRNARKLKSRVHFPTGNNLFTASFLSLWKCFGYETMHSSYSHFHYTVRHHIHTVHSAFSDYNLYCLRNVDSPLTRHSVVDLFTHTRTHIQRNEKFSLFRHILIWNHQSDVFFKLNRYKIYVYMSIYDAVT